MLKQPVTHFIVSICTSFTLTACSSSGETMPEGFNPQVVMQHSGVDALLQAVSAVSEEIAWVSGHNATFGRTRDGGATWEMGQVPGPDTLQFRDVHGVSSDVAYLLAAGPADMSRIYKTMDGGATWELQFQNNVPAAFYDCFDFWDAESGLAYGDAVEGEMVVIRTRDGGATWTRIEPDRLPAPRGSEGGFAASGTCLVVQGDRDAWIGTGAGDTARVLHTMDRGDSWTAVETPILSGSGSSGIASLVFGDLQRGIALGGDIAAPEDPADNVITTNDGGSTWTLAGRPTFTGAIYGGGAVPNTAGGTVVAVGPKGMSYTTDYGHTWMALDTNSYWAVGFASPTAGWAVGPGGRIAKVGG